MGESEGVQGRVKGYGESDGVRGRVTGYGGE